MTGLMGGLHLFATLNPCAFGGAAPDAQEGRPLRLVQPPCAPSRLWVLDRQRKWKSRQALQPMDFEVFVRNVAAGRLRLWIGVVMRLYGVRRWGSTIAECMLALAGEAYEFTDVEGFDQPGAPRELLSGINPLTQVPTLVFDDGTVLTETAAIALWLVERHPLLAPEAGSADHVKFLRVLVWMVANVYPTFTYGDYPERWVSTGRSELVASTDAFRESLYRWLEGQLVGPFALGRHPGILDCYLAVMLDWRPRAAWFQANTPRLAHAAEMTRALPELGVVMELNGLKPIAL